MQMCNGLMRYHSAPSSMLAGLLNEDILPRDSDAFTQVEDPEFARFLDDHLCSMANPHLGPKPSPSAHNEIRPELYKTSATQQPPCMENGCSTSIKDVFRGPLSSISELRADESNEFCSPFQLNAPIKMGEASHSNLPKSPSMPISNIEGALAHVKSCLAQNNSSPADILSRLIMEEGNGETVLHFGGHFTQELGKGSIADETESGLLRQNSSPAGLLSQMSFAGMSSSTCSKLSSSPLSENSSEEERRGGAWDEMGSDKAGLVHRKRGREGHGMHRLQSSESSFTNLNAPHVGDGHVSMEVLCKVSAKRGCATHPRSIAERVRRNKINEGIRKLQELMPNMEKQTNTVAMLDEAVEYVKSLQRQVQELSESRPKCNGQCHLKGNA